LSDSLVIIPTYNESTNISQVIEKVIALPEVFDSLIVDDNSPDGTARIVEKLQEQHPGRISLLKRERKLGLGKAYIAGFEWALAREYGYIFEMDADLSHDPKDLIRLKEACHGGGADVCVGSRYVKGGNVMNWAWTRRLLSYSASLYVRALLDLPLKDPTAGFVCYKREVLQNIPFQQIQFAGYAFQIDMKQLCWKHKFVIREIPITFTERTQGKSKMSQTILREAIAGVWRLRNANRADEQ